MDENLIELGMHFTYDFITFRDLSDLIELEETYLLYKAGKFSARLSMLAPTYVRQLECMGDPIYLTHTIVTRFGTNAHPTSGHSSYYIA